MNADIKGALEQISKSYRVFTHRGASLTKNQVKEILEYGIRRGYKSTSELSDHEVDKILKSIKL